MEQVFALEEAWERHLRADGARSRTPRTYVYSSGLMQIGPRCNPPFEVIEGQRPFRIQANGLDLIHGKIDGRLQFDRNTRPIFEVKSGEMASRINDLEGMERSPWTRHWPDQLGSYLFSENEENGLFILDRPGMPRFLPLSLEHARPRVEQFLLDAREAVLAATGKAELPAFTQHLAECRRCPHALKSCTPPVLSAGPGLKVIEDLDLVALAEVREQCRDAAKEYDHADGILKKALRGIEHGVMGPFEITGKWGRQTKLEMPEDVKKQYQVVDEHGRFSLSIERAFEDRPPIDATPAQESASQAA